MNTTDKLVDNTVNTDDQKKFIEENISYILVAILFIIIYIIIAILTWAFSVSCLMYGGSFIQNWIGIFISFLWPFYWIYYAVSPSYCCSKSGGRKQVIQKKFSKVRKAIKKF
jgi:accessory gene regulator protein AgrB